MPGTWSQLLVHFVFATKKRSPWISAEVASRLHPYMGGIIRAEKCVPLEIGGVEDHVHLLVRCRPDLAVSDLMRTAKASSSKWIHETFPDLREFAWQEGYAAFSVSKSAEDAVRAYIRNQVEHHRKEDFKSELVKMLKLHEVEVDERYLFD